MKDLSFTELQHLVYILTTNFGIVLNTSTELSVTDDTAALGYNDLRLINLRYTTCYFPAYAALTYDLRLSDLRLLHLFLRDYPYFCTYKTAFVSFL